MRRVPTTTAIPGLVLTEHEFSCPLTTRVPRRAITVFAREVADPDGRDRPLLLFLQGGPGFEAPRPTGAPTISGWVPGAARLPRSHARPARHAVHAGRREGSAGRAGEPSSGG